MALQACAQAGCYHQHCLSVAGPDPATIALLRLCQRSLPPSRTETLHGRLKRPAGADPHRSPAPWPSGTGLPGARVMQHPWVLSISAWCTGTQRMPSLASLLAAVLGCNLGPGSARPGCAPQIPMPSSPMSPEVPDPVCNGGSPPTAARRSLHHLHVPGPFPGSLLCHQCLARGRGVAQGSPRARPGTGTLSIQPHAAAAGCGPSQSPPVSLWCCSVLSVV